MLVHALSLAGLTLLNLKTLEVEGVLRGLRTRAGCSRWDLRELMLSGESVEGSYVSERMRDQLLKKHLQGGHYS